jgi:hypothetical protein
VTRDPLKDAILFGDTWTPPHGTDKMTKRRLARARLRRWTRRLIDRVLGPDEDDGHDDGREAR